MSEHTVKYQIASLLEAVAHDKSGSRLGSVEGIFLDDKRSVPTFVEVNHGLFGRSSSVVPLRGSSLDAHNLTLGFDKDTIKDAPDIDPENGLSRTQQDQVFVHYGLMDAQDADYFHTGDGDQRDHSDPTNTAPTSSREEAAAGTPAATGVGAGAPSGANRSDADTTVSSETSVNAAREMAGSTSQQSPDDRIRFRRFSDRQTGTVK